MFFFLPKTSCQNSRLVMTMFEQRTDAHIFSNGTFSCIRVFMVNEVGIYMDEQLIPGNEYTCRSVSGKVLFTRYE